MVVEQNEFDALVNRILQVETNQRDNLPKLLNALRRLAKVEKTMSATVLSVAAINTMAKGSAEQIKTNAEILEKANQTLTDNTTKLDNIFGFLSYAKTWSGIARKHGPRFFAFAIGVAVASGRLTPEWAQKILHLFGL